jgi:hypothetical protein
VIEAVVLAIIVAVIVGLVLYGVGMFVKAMGGAAPPLAAIGDFLMRFCWVIGLLAGLLYFFGGARHF